MLTRPILKKKVSDKDQQKDHDDGRNIDATETGEDIPHRSQGGFREPVERVADGVDDTVLAIDHIERHEPAKDRARDNQPDIDCYDAVDQNEKRIHGEPSKTLIERAAHKRLRNLLLDTGNASFRVM